MENATLSVYWHQILRMPGVGNGLTARQSALMVKRIASVGTFTFCLLAACGALGQSERPADAARSLPLPDAPTAQVQTEGFQIGSGAGPSPVTVGKLWINAGGKIATDTVFGRPLNATVLDSAVRPQKRSDDFFSKYLATPGRQNARYQPSSSDKMMGRATDAASRIFVTRDESGKRRLNTQYFLRVLTSVAADSASRRYRARSGTAPLSSFGSAVGNDAGMNLLHEFGPGIRQKMSGHMPGVVTRIGERLIRMQHPK